MFVVLVLSCIASFMQVEYMIDSSSMVEDMFICQLGSGGRGTKSIH